jgi:hypothetical protein
VAIISRVLLLPPGLGRLEDSRDVRREHVHLLACQRPLRDPAVFASLIAVDNESFPDPTTFEFHTGRPMELAARGIYVRAPKSGGGYQLWTGTSFACPHITGLVARLLSLNPQLTPFQIKTLLHVLRANRSCDGASGRSVTK